MSAAKRHFARHYVEMVIAMFLGMVVLWPPTEAALQLVGSGTGKLTDSAPWLVLLWMGVVMTVPMVAWMRYRGHSWRPCAEMAASMLIPTLAVIAVLEAGIVEDFMTLMTAEHVVMLPSMLVAMLLRPQEYSCAHGHHQPEPEVAA